MTDRKVPRLAPAAPASPSEPAQAPAFGDPNETMRDAASPVLTGTAPLIEIVEKGKPSTVILPAAPAPARLRAEFADAQVALVKEGAEVTRIKRAAAPAPLSGDLGAPPDLVVAAERVWRKYGSDKDWTEWRDLREALDAARAGAGAPDLGEFEGLVEAFERSASDGGWDRSGVDASRSALLAWARRAREERDGWEYVAGLNKASAEGKQKLLDEVREERDEARSGALAECEKLEKALTIGTPANRCSSGAHPAIGRCACTGRSRLTALIDLAILQLDGQRQENELHLRDWRKLLLLIAEVCGEEDPESAVEDEFDPWTALRELGEATYRTEGEAKDEALATAREEGRRQGVEEAAAVAHSSQASCFCESLGSEMPCNACFEAARIEGAIRALAEGAADGKGTTDGEA